MTKDKGYSTHRGVACFFQRLDEESSRLCFTDIKWGGELEVLEKELKEPFISKSYTKEQIINSQISEKELATIGQIILTRAFAHSQPRTNRKELLGAIREAFQDVPFPEHLGLIAAEAIDDWVSDNETLRRLTADKDFHGPWWEIPESYLKRGSLGLNYLDSKGFAFYLPAFMSLAIRDPIYSNFSALIGELNPVYEGEFEDLYEHFCEKLSLLTVEQKKTCTDFMVFMREELLFMSPVDFALEYVKDIEQALKHEFWQC